MALRSSLLRQAARRFSSAAEAMDKAATKGPKLPAGNDPSAMHDVQHAISDTNRWRNISLVFFLPVTAFFVINLMSEHEHGEAPPEYPYLKMASRSPRFPWGDDDLLGTSHDRHAKQQASESSE